MDASYFIATLASARAAGMFGGGNGPASTSTKAAFRDIGANRTKLCWRSSISAGVICLFIFFSSSRYTITLRDYQSMADAVGQQYCPRQHSQGCRSHNCDLLCSWLSNLWLCQMTSPHIPTPGVGACANLLHSPLCAIR